MPVELEHLPVVIMTVASVVLPFMYPEPKDAGARFAVVLPGARRKQRLLAALVLLVLAVGVYALIRYRPVNPWVLLAAPPIFFVVLVEMLSDGVVERFLLPVGRGYLVLAGVAVACLLTLALLWTSMTGELRIFDGNDDRYVLTHDRDAFLFWYFVVGTAVVNFIAIRLLREWFAHRRRARHAGQPA